MVKLQMFSSKGIKVEALSLPKKYDQEFNINLLSQAVYVYQDRNHFGNSKVKTRSEVTASGAKIYRQKGTGRARHGDIKAPIFVGGGIAHGPKGVKKVLKLSKNMRRKALITLMKYKASNGSFVLVDKIKTITKTKEAGELIDKIKKELKLNVYAKTLLTLADANQGVSRNFRNISNLSITPWSKLNAYNVFNSSLLIADKDALDQKEVEKNQIGQFVNNVEKKKDVKSMVKEPKKMKKINIKSKTKKLTKKVVKRKK